ncbi:MAG: hypothetical protein A3I44_00090 [Candidatus Sungbacteria bacterium RIFCSPLOWO2_02_FULL_51_17]|uniref:4-aminobutyrate aminotransferase n=1 Tax=Candidatus Sungbacteria bacterium RIFCSPHIGHO2_02_FULL_51_29 TaxID=1802273 RepID=A0A1G2KQS5_9BACT|nr:MAG: hypothetical protein A2676_05525 [Candidatus Sungbacteria bacterium RIFCSPHIGHO2_01_FULL_51_22]OHA01778.1 MAG: hypothetical protein A3C16_02730 [Candidatus Sungbacteria bacterium RIFCSPHIGHO2_02_FULL_51_29]OHA07972.1 MAG: hypothetical protein A3B29_04220 [Candidatus Sungbacteria bacterium RIFCSPLOWO2_01_FULL_51_34]OHA11556.1 MAG: hypothetical protein A3I44_00090 [Candidatus Sungbacteria bacterium RIFCSPLOWO2_02_FULL_51_17]
MRAQGMQYGNTADFATEYIRRHEALIAPNTRDAELGMVIQRARGTRLWDSTGKEYIDFDGSVAVAGIGHKHPRVAEAIAQLFDPALDTIDFVEATGRHYCFDITLAGKRIEVSEAALAETLIPCVFNGAVNDFCVIPTITGKLAVDGATALTLKMRPEKTHYIAFEKAFHGRLGFAGEYTRSKPIQKKDYPNSGITVHHLPFPQTEEDLKRGLELLNYIPLDRVNAVIYETVQGEGGINKVSFPRMQALLSALTAGARERILVIADEIQSGLGRTGKWFAFQHGPIEPDIVLVGKSLGGGLPVSAIVFKKDMFFAHSVRGILERGWFSGTFPGYPLGSAAALAVLGVIKEEKLVERAEEMGTKLATALGHFDGNTSNGALCRQKGLGLMQGLEFRKHDSIPDPKRRNTVLMALKNAKPLGILTLGAGIDALNPTIRFLPPLTVSREEIGYLETTLAWALTKN